MERGGECKREDERRRMKMGWMSIVEGGNGWNESGDDGGRDEEEEERRRGELRRGGEGRGGDG